MKAGDKKIAITHDYLIEYGGAELVLLEILKLFPQADLYSPVYKEKKSQREFWAEVSKHKVYTSKLSRLPAGRLIWKLFLPWHKKFFENLDLSSYDIVISSSAGFAKFVNTRKGTRHIAYIHTPPRFLWGYETSFFHRIPNILKIIFRKKLKQWKSLDKKYAQKADIIITNSENIQRKIRKCYKRTAGIIYPPVDLRTIQQAPEETQQEFYLTLSRLHKYKRVDLIIQAFNKNQRKLVIIGDGPEKEELEKIAGKNIEFKGFIDEQAKIKMLKQAKAFVFAGEEDFGIVMIEALAAGTPVIAYRKGGALEIIKEGINGFFFAEQTPNAINIIIKQFENMGKSSINKREILKSAEIFSTENFQKKLFSIIMPEKSK